ncbi:GNAT family N-acetyltransferase [Ichthyenterobacterium magnum]|uniref:Acetyltransferase (GNAT) family protein n=1 Tax=Ichthyenterobacterium magnum TaxID=1230530 RepID=A0A420DGY5_9FLAO|nr:GNAT family N-acetyltransferase [Ichthyenterobacterium magnum]RKE92339.1 acetyltransferase (GNAT) family protein [Ichthyenterobacterium magnum]
MVKIIVAKNTDAKLLALLSRQTYIESHGHFIADKNDLKAYTKKTFSVSKTEEDISNTKNLFYIVYVNDLPVGYAKLILNTSNKNIASQNNCRLERIYILSDFIPLKIGQQLLTFVVEKAKALQFDTIWLSVYIKNNRAIRFYEKNEFINVGELNFLVNGKVYENIVFSKKI